MDKNKSNEFDPSQSVSIADKPVKLSSEDKLETAKYARSLARFITACETPMTVGIQGEWGSGKTSLMNMIQQYLKETPVRYRKKEADASRATIKPVEGEKYFELVWVNTWEHSLLKTNEECLVSILEEIIEKIATRGGSWNLANQAKSALSTVLKGAARVGASVTMGVHAGQVADEILGGSKSNGVKELRDSLKQVIKQAITDDKALRFIVFVDDLDRLEPSVAVQILELLKNIFELEHCVFILAIDYQVVVKGLEKKFGPPSEANEWEFRAFFDKIIQVPFMMPMAQYQLDDYVISKLTLDKSDPQNPTGIDYLTNKEAGQLKGVLGSIAELTIGNNPRAIKRLLNSVSLIRLQNQGSAESDIELQNVHKKEKLDNTIKILQERMQLQIKQLIFALVCIQIAFPKTYELLLRDSNFRGWDDEFFEKITSGKPYKRHVLETAQTNIEKTNQQDFDDDWEKSLFKIIWVMEWQRDRVVDISRILSKIEDTILGSFKDEDFNILIDNCLSMTAVTSIASTSDSVLAKNKSSADETNKSSIAEYWTRFSTELKKADVDCIFKKFPPRAIHTSTSLARKMDDVGVELLAQINSATPLQVRLAPKREEDEYKALIIEIRKQLADLEKDAGVTVTVKNFEGAAKNITLNFGSPASVDKQVSLLKNEKAAGEVITWFTEKMPTIEKFIREKNLVRLEGKSTSVSTSPIQ